jgi:hypothetical protein
MLLKTVLLFIAWVPQAEQWLQQRIKLLVLLFLNKN